jgi:hypothetical protein
MSVNEQLVQLVDELSPEEAEEVLDYVQWLLLDEDEISDEDMQRVLAGEEQIRRGEYVTLDELRRHLTE